MIHAHEFLEARILIVDDEPANVQLLERLLCDVGYSNIHSTRDSLQVCTLHLDTPYDLILLDLQMPGMDGFRVMEALQAQDGEGYLPVIVLTAQPGHKLRALQAGAKDFISKPFDLAEVRTRIHNMLEVRLLHKKLDEHNRALEQTVRERTADLRQSEARYRGLTELAADWYWEQNVGGDFTQVSGPVQEMLGIRVTAFLSPAGSDQTNGWNENERQILQGRIADRLPFQDFPFSRTNADGSQQQFRVSGEPMLDASGHCIGYRGIGAEVRVSPSTAAH